MKVLLATGIEELDEMIQQGMESDDVAFTKTVQYRAALIDTVNDEEPDLIVLSELLSGPQNMRELILKLRSSSPDTRIVYILKENDADEKDFLFKWQVFDILIGEFDLEDLRDRIFTPRSFKDVVKEMDELNGIQPSSRTGSVDHLYNIEDNEYESLDTPSGSSKNLYQEIVSFWSVSDRAGKTFSAINTSLMLASRQDLKILLIDFNIDNPAVNLYMKFTDPEKNIGAIIEDIESGYDLDKTNLDDYLITHPTYDNLKILPGAILKMERQPDQVLYHIFELIIKAAEESNYTTIMVDVGSGVDSDLTTNILKRSSKILLHIPDCPGSLNAVNRCFDNQFGPFVEKLIDNKKITPVVTMTSENSIDGFKKVVERTVDDTKVGAFLYNEPEVLTSLYEGKPLLSKRPKESIYDSFIDISNTIHPKIFLSQNKKSKKKDNGSKKTPSFFNLLKPPKKKH